MTSITQTRWHPGPFPSHRRISYYFSKRGWSLLQVFTPNKSLLIAWKSIFREGVVLQLHTPNIALTDLAVSSLSPNLIRLTYNSYAVFYASPFISHPCLMHSSLHSSPCSAWLCPSFLLFHSATAVRLPHSFLLFHFMAMLDACRYIMSLDTGIF